MKPVASLISLWFGAVMIVVVFSGVIAFAFTDVMSDRLFGTRRTVFVFILLAYGIYRSMRAYQAFKESRNEKKLF